MNARQRNALDRAVREAQDRTRRNLNRDVEADVQDARDAETEAQQRRRLFRVVSEA